MADLKARFPSAVRKGVPWETGMGKEIFAGLPMTAWYYADDAAPFCMVALLPEPADRARTVEAVVRTYGRPPTDRALWRRGSVVIEVKAGGVLVTVADTDPGRCPAAAPPPAIERSPSPTQSPAPASDQSRRYFVVITHNGTRGWSTGVVVNGTLVASGASDETVDVTQHVRAGVNTVLLSASRDGGRRGEARVEVQVVSGTGTADALAVDRTFVSFARTATDADVRSQKFIFTAR